LSQGAHSIGSELRIEAKPRPRALAEPYPSQLERMRVDPGAIDAQAPGELGSIDQLEVCSRVLLKQVNDPTRDRLDGSGMELDAARFHDFHPLCPPEGRIASLDFAFSDVLGGTPQEGA